MSDDSVLIPFTKARHSHSRCVNEAIALAETVCAERGLRLTKLRRRVLELVWGSHEPVKAYDLLDKLRDEHQAAAPPTVYRALDFLLQEGLIHRIESLNAYLGCGKPSEQHSGQFLICLECGHVAELDDHTVSSVLADKASTLGFSVEHAIIELAGRCQSCREKA